MKHAKTFPLFIAIVATLASCGSIRPIKSGSSQTSSSSSKIEESSSSKTPVSSTGSSSVASSSSNDSSSSEQKSPSSLESTTPASSSDSSSLSSETSSSSSSSSKSSEEWNDEWNGQYTFYGVNDFQGAIVEQTNSSNYYESGIKKYFGELKARKDADPNHTFVISVGDMYQGSLESNENYGNLITEAMNVVPFDAMTLGNHEFDYGQDKLLQNIEIANFPVLAGNIYKWDTTNNKASNTRWDKVGLSTVLERNGLKVGVVGLIGEGQTTSITSKNVSDLTFINSENIAKKEATRLREEEGCHIVICSLHADQSEITNKWDDSDLKTYFDAVFCGHSHRKNDSVVNGTPLVQSYCNGEYVSKVVLTVNNGNVTCTSHGLEGAKTSWRTSDEISAICDKYLDAKFEEKANRVCGTLTDSSLNNSTVANLGCKAIFNAYVDKYPNLTFALMNSQRDGLDMGEFTYSRLYKSMPFTNKIVIAEIKGDDLQNVARKNCTYTGDTTKYATLDSGTYYQVAMIDYVIYHQNIYKKYDNIDSLNPGNGGKIIAEYDTIPVDLTFNYVKNDLKGTISSEACSGKANGFALYA